MIRLLSTALLASGLAAPCALAQTPVQRTFVSTAGDDTNTASSCSATAPCRSFASALSVTKPGGEIVPLTSGGYGAVTIGQSVQIAAPLGVYAAITAASGNAITVAAGASDIVVLKGLVLNGLGTGTNGINATTFSTLTIENCTVSEFNGIGIFVDASATGDRVYIKDTSVRNGSDAGVYLRATGNTLTASIVNSVSDGNATNGFLSARGAKTTISGSEAAGNSGAGFAAYGDRGQTAELNCDRCVASGNGGTGFSATGYNSNGNGIMRVARSTATDNQIGFAQVVNYAGTSTFVSLSGTNLVSGNTTDTSGTITSVTSP